ncbi:MAG: PD-(D/E)XK nuclease family protein [Fervidobacterium sp.]
MSKKAFVVPLDTSHFETVARAIERYYLENPLDFLFIGPTGFYTRQVADLVARNIKKTLNRDAFRVVNQYITEMLKFHNYDAEVLDRDFYTIYIKYLIDQKYDSYKPSAPAGDVKLVILRTLSKSNTIISYIVDIFEKLWELELYGDTSDLMISGQYALIKNILSEDVGQEDIFTGIIREILTEMNNVAGQLRSTNVYDPMSVYRWYVENAANVEQSRKYVIFSGFFDLPPLMQKSFKSLINKSENAIFFVWQKVDDPAFNQLDDVYRFLIDNGFTLDYSLCQKREASFEEVLKGRNISKVDVQNQHAQYSYLIKAVKQLILSGESPDNIAIIAPNLTIASRVMEELDDALIPYRSSGKYQLVESQIVKILLQPMQAVEDDFSSEDLLAIIESPLVPERSLTMDEVEDFFRRYGYFSIKVNQTHMKDKLTRSQLFLEQLVKDIDDLEHKKAEELMEDDVYLSSIEQLEKLKSFKTIMEQLFAILDDIIESRAKKVSFFDWYRNFVKKAVQNFKGIFELGSQDQGQKSQKFSKNSIVSKSIGKELNAFTRFVQVLNDLQLYVEKIEQASGKEIKNWSNLFKMFLVLLNSSGYRETFRSASVVDIMDVSTARFVSKKYKFFIEFTDDFYPSIDKINPLLYRTSKEKSRIYDLLEETERRAIVLSMVFSDRAELIVPRASTIGDSLVPSKYLVEFVRGEPIEYETSAGDIFKLIDYEIYKLTFEERKRVQMNEADYIVGKTGITEFSHSRISDYLKCPLYYYFADYVGIRKPLDSIARFNISKGLIVHRVLKAFFDNTIPFALDEKEILNMLRKEYASFFNDGIYKYKIPREIYIQERFKEIEPFLSNFIQSKQLIKLGQKSITMSQSEQSEDKKVKKGSDKKPSLYSDETMCTEMDFRMKFKDYSLTARVDRIDRLRNNYALSEGDLENGEYEKADDKAFAIIDYKHTTNLDNSAQIEQLMLYDYVIMHHLADDKSDIDEPLYLKELKDEKANVFLILLATSPSSNSYNYFYVKRQYSVEAEYFIPYKSKPKNAYISISQKEFEKWLDWLLERISKEGKFIPVYLREETASFINQITAHIGDIDLLVPKSSKEPRKCRAYNSSCPYEPLCLAAEMYGLKLTDAQNRRGKR